MMRSLNVSRCARDIGKHIVDTPKISVCDTRRLKVFEIVALGSAGDLLFAMNLIQKQCVFFMCSIVGIVTELGNKGCDDLRARF